jgi:hypothetical protein
VDDKDIEQILNAAGTYSILLGQTLNHILSHCVSNCGEKCVVTARKIGRGGTAVEGLVQLPGEREESSSDVRSRDHDQPTHVHAQLDGDGDDVVQHFSHTASMGR